MIENEFVNFKEVDMWLQKNADLIKHEFPSMPNSEIEIRILDEDNILSGKTRIEKKQDLKVKITIFVSKNVLKRKNIKQGIKAVLIHEFCHIVSPLDPDKVMEIYFPQVWEAWRRAQESEALNCDVRVFEGEGGV